MKIFVDTHCHTIASGHAYSTVMELANCAKSNGLKMFAMTDHGPAMPGGPHLFYISNQRIIPRIINDIVILKGVELNILDSNGNVDVSNKALSELDFVIASLHDVCIKPMDIEYNTNALLNVMDNPYVDVLGHIGNPIFPIDVDKVLKKAKEKNILIEINNSSLRPDKKSRGGSKENCYKIAKRANELGVKILLSTDSHIALDIGIVNHSIDLVESVSYDKSLIINSNLDSFLEFLKSKNKKYFSEIKESIEKIT